MSGGPLQARNSSIVSRRVGVMAMPLSWIRREIALASTRDPKETDVTRRGNDAVALPASDG